MLFYSSHHYTEQLSVRQDSLRDNYLFTCDCDACTHNFGTFNELLAKDVAQLITSNDKIQLEQLNKKFAIANHQRFAEYLKQYDHLYPCKQLNLVQHHFRESLHIMAENYSIKLEHLNDY